MGNCYKALIGLNHVHLSVSVELSKESLLDVEFHHILPVSLEVSLSQDLEDLQKTKKVSVPSVSCKGLFSLKLIFISK